MKGFSACAVLPPPNALVLPYAPAAFAVPPYEPLFHELLLPALLAAAAMACMGHWYALGFSAAAGGVVRENGGACTGAAWGGEVF